MTDAHCHVARGETRHFLCAPRMGAAGAQDVVFDGCHPWDVENVPNFDEFIQKLRMRLGSVPTLGVGEIGLDRLRSKTISEAMRGAFDAQLAVAAEFRRPVQLHGAKCWGEVVKSCRPFAGRIPAFVFHGFSRSDGLLPDIVALGGFVSVGPAILNDHAVNYRAMVKKVPAERLLVESDATEAAAAPRVDEVAAKLAEVRGIGLEELIARLERNADEVAP
ncbi:MAG: TatD family hydrolase [Kiritimatiellae bacterium]|nr:TatD family hydrolase [Kiritimatiellia bacterium]